VKSSETPADFLEAVTEENPRKGSFIKSYARKDILESVSNSPMIPRTTWLHILFDLSRPSEVKHEIVTDKVI